MPTMTKAFGGALIAAFCFAPLTVAAAAHAAPLPGATQVKYYKNCDAARADGNAPIRRGEDGYRDQLDRDGDGIACEPKP